MRGDDHEARRGAMKQAETIGSAGKDDAYVFRVGLLSARTEWPRRDANGRRMPRGATCAIRGTSTG